MRDLGLLAPNTLIWLFRC